MTSLSGKIKPFFPIVLYIGLVCFFTFTGFYLFSFILPPPLSRLVLIITQNYTMELFQLFFFHSFNLRTFSFVYLSSSNELHQAVLNGELDVFFLLTFSLSIYTSKYFDKLNNWTLFYIGNVELIKSLMQSGIDPNVKDRDGQTPMFLALQKGIQMHFTSIIR